MVQKVISLDSMYRICMTVRELHCHGQMLLTGIKYNDPQFLEGRQPNMPSFDITYNNIIAFLAADITIK